MAVVEEAVAVEEVSNGIELKSNGASAYPSSCRATYYCPILREEQELVLQHRSEGERRGQVLW